MEKRLSETEKTFTKKLTGAKTAEGCHAKRTETYCRNVALKRKLTGPSLYGSSALLCVMTGFPPFPTALDHPGVDSYKHSQQDVWFKKNNEECFGTPQCLPQPLFWCCGFWQQDTSRPRGKKAKLDIIGGVAAGELSQ